MRFMVLVYPAAKEVEQGKLPDRALLEEMGKYNEELQKAGVLLALDGLQPSMKGARVKFAGSKRNVTTGPFTEATELVGGYWLWQCKSKEEAIEWAKRAPMQEGDTLEIRQVFEMSDFGEDIANAPASQRLKAGLEKR